jgi:STE24 endopeptidase
MSDEAAARYHRLQFSLGLLALIVGAAYLVLVLVTGAARVFAQAWSGLAESWWLQIAGVAATVGLGHTVLTAPLAWVRGYWLPRRFGLLHQPFAAWLADRGKALALSALLGVAGLEAIYATLRFTTWWWLWAAAAFLLLYTVMTAIVPLWVLPLFYRLRPLEDGPLRARILDLAQRLGVPAVDVVVADHSRKSRTANAAVVGLGRTRRILLFDTLLQHFSPEQVESVLAHELGHHVHGDIRRGLVAQTVLTLVTFAAADAVFRAGVRPLGLEGIADPGGLPWLVLVLSALTLVLVPLANAFSRVIERQADDFALAATRDPAAFIGAMDELARLNLAERRPHRLKELLLYSHPAIDRRIARARALQGVRG